MQDLDPIAALEYRVSELERQNGQMLQPAKVTYVYRKAGEAGIKSDRDDGTWLGYVDVEVDKRPIQRIPTMTIRHGDDRSFWLPSEDERGMLLSPSGDYANAFFAPSIAFKKSERLTPEGNSQKQHITRYADNIEHITDTEEHSDVLKVPHNDGKIERKVKDTTITIEDGKITLESGTAKFEITNTEIKGTVGTTRFKFTATKADIRVATTWILLLPTLANINGATFVSGITNMMSSIPVTYVPIPAGDF